MKCDKISSIPEKNKLVVLISDGQPNYYYDANGNLKNPSGGEASTKEVCDSAVAAANEIPGEKYAVYIGKLSDSCYGSYSGSEPAETTLSYYKLLPGAATVTVTHKYIPYITVTSYEKDDEGNIISWKTEELPDEENIAEYTVYYGKEGEAADGISYVPGPYYEGERVSVEMRPEGFTPRGDVPGKIADVRAHGQTIELVYEKHDNDRRDEADYEVYHRFYYSEKYVDETGALKTWEVYERGNDAPIDSGKEKIGAELPVAKPEYAGYAVKPGTPDKKTIELGLNVV